MEKTSSKPVYQVFAIKYAGPVRKSGSHLRWQKDWDKEATGNYYIWLVKNGQRTVVIDTGCTPETAREKALSFYMCPSRLLPSAGVDPKEIEYVILTHLHWDHAGGAIFFPHANFFLHEKEYSFWTGNGICNSPPLQSLIDRKCLKLIRSLYNDNRVALIKNNRDIFPGIGAIFAPGHSPGLMAISVNTAKGTLILGSDSAFAVENYEEKWPHDIFFNMADYLKTMAMLRRKASKPELLFAGHDPAMFNDYPRVGRHMTRLA
jgi:glyoxylase-like metal-dependent hydrolase (beta-lactamase superfamily II)